MNYTEMLNVCKNINSSNASKKVVVVGDYFLDKYVYMMDSDTGSSLYTSKPAYVIRATRTSPGAAGTVAKNLANLGIGTVYAVGYRGYDGDGFTLEHDLQKLGIDTDKLFVLEHFSTPSYTMITERSEDILHASASMPRHYRTPELVAYAKKETNRFYMESDAFQMGLVICWLFTGVNPLLASEDKLSGIELCDINKLTGCLDYRIANMIRKMTAIERTERMSPETALNSILGISRDIETAERLVS